MEMQKYGDLPEMPASLQELLVIVVTVVALLAGLGYWLSSQMERKLVRETEINEAIPKWLAAHECMNVSYSDRVGRIYRCNDGLFYSIFDVRREVDPQR